MKVEFRPYQSADEESLLKVFDSNMPDYFASIERQPFIDFLRGDQVEVYELIYVEDQLIGAGGYCIESPKDARIVWLMVNREHHQNGFGKIMMEHLMHLITKAKCFEKISLMTSQLTDAFYAKLGFITTKSEDDYWFKGMHLRYMEKKLK